jgi:SAM-dependent MidA family methyltransferase
MSQEEPETFETFMRRALYDPAHGYYSGNIRSIGRRGDFTTAPMLSDLPARAIAAWAARAMRESGCRNLIEIGPGEGKLAAAVIAALPWHVRWKTHLHLVETSASLAATQGQTLGKNATWHQTPAAALKACDGKAVIFSNELVDAFPVRRFEKSTDGWREIAVGFDAGGRVRESLMPPAPLPNSSGFSTTHPDGQRIEVHESFHAWLRDWLPLWKTGRMLTIDYGSTADGLYHRRPRGTIRGYLMHQLVEGAEIYRNIGRQDLTADVNFSDLINWSAPWMDDTRLLTFGDFLTTLGQLKNPNDLHLADSTGPGGAFLVLDQRRASLGHRIEP